MKDHEFCVFSFFWLSPSISHCVTLCLILHLDCWTKILQETFLSLTMILTLLYAFIWIVVTSIYIHFCVKYLFLYMYIYIFFIYKILIHSSIDKHWILRLFIYFGYCGLCCNKHDWYIIHIDFYTFEILFSTYCHLSWEWAHIFKIHFSLLYDFIFVLSICIVGKCFL